MLVKNYAKPFCLAGFLLAEIYMLLVVLAPYGHDRGRGLLSPLPIEPEVVAGAPVPLWHMAERVVAGAVLSGPFGALVGLGIGLLFSALVQWWRGRKGVGEKG